MKCIIRLAIQLVSTYILYYIKNNFHPVFYNWHDNTKKSDSIKSILDKTSEHMIWLVKSRGWA